MKCGDTAAPHIIVLTAGILLQAVADTKAAARFRIVVTENGNLSIHLRNECVAIQGLRRRSG